MRTQTQKTIVSSARRPRGAARFPKWTVPCLIALAALLAVAPLGAVSKVFVQNNTSLSFGVASTQSGSSLSSSKWGQHVSSIKQGERSQVVWFNRDSGITSGKYFYFDTALSNGGNQLILKQRLKGQWIGSHMWQSLSGYGIYHSWYDDRSTHSATWYVAGKTIEVKYRAYFTGGDDHIEYILTEKYTVAPGGADTFSVLSYNIYMRPDSLFANGQDIRAGLIPPVVRGYDAIVFSEAFDDGARAKLLSGLRSEYPYATRIVGKDAGVYQDGGVIIVSRYPIEREAQRTFGGNCSGSDCLSDKGVMYARINKLGRRYNLFGTHTQAWSTAEGREVRKVQFRIIKTFIDAQNIPASEPVIIAGDLNVDRVHYNDEYIDMLNLLNAAQPGRQGHAYTFDASINRLASGSTKEYLDYALYSRAHLVPQNSFNEVRMIRSLTEWKEFFWEVAYWDLSDHFAIYGRFEFNPAENVPGYLLPYFSGFSFPSLF